MDFTHELPVTPCQIIVDRHHKDTFSLKSVEVSWQGSHQCFPLTGFHFCDIPFVQHQPADELNQKGLKTDGPIRRFSYHRKSLYNQMVHRLPVFEPFPEYIGFIPEGAVAKGRGLTFQCQYLICYFLKPFYITLGWVKNLI